MEFKQWSLLPPIVRRIVFQFWVPDDLDLFFRGLSLPSPRNTGDRNGYWYTGQVRYFVVRGNGVAHTRFCTNRGRNQGIVGAKVYRNVQDDLDARLLAEWEHLLALQTGRRGLPAVLGQGGWIGCSASTITRRRHPHPRTIEGEARLYHQFSRGVDCHDLGTHQYVLELMAYRSDGLYLGEPRPFPAYYDDTDSDTDSDDETVPEGYEAQVARGDVTVYHDREGRYIFQEQDHTPRGRYHVLGGPNGHLYNAHGYQLEPISWRRTIAPGWFVEPAKTCHRGGQFRLLGGGSNVLIGTHRYFFRDVRRLCPLGHKIVDFQCHGRNAHRLYTRMLKLYYHTGILDSMNDLGVEFVDNTPENQCPAAITLPISSNGRGYLVHFSLERGLLRTAKFLDRFPRVSGYWPYQPDVLYI